MFVAMLALAGQARQHDDGLAQAHGRDDDAHASVGNHQVALAHEVGIFVLGHDAQQTEIAWLVLVGYCLGHNLFACIIGQAVDHLD